MSGPEITIGARITDLCRAHPDTIALVVVAPDGQETAFTWAELASRIRVAQYHLERRIPNPGAVVVIAIPAGADHVAATVAAWRLGATVIPLDHELPEASRTRIAERAGATLVIDPASVAELRDPDVPASYPGLDIGIEGAALPRSAHATGGTTGESRIILRRHPWIYPAELAPSEYDSASGVGVGERQLVLTPLHHSGFARLYHGLALDHYVVVMRGFAPALMLDVVRRHRITYFEIVPAMMQLVLDRRADADLLSVRCVHHSAAGTPESVKRAWLGLMPPDRVWEAYAMQERLGSVWIRGDEWLRHPGSVGRPTTCEVRILGADGVALPAGEVGQIFMGGPSARQPHYLGPGPVLAEHDGLLSVGDLGYLDGDGYLHVIGRDAEMINVGGVNVYPGKVEEALRRHPGVADVAVVGRPNHYLGQVPHALVVPRSGGTAPAPADLRALCREHLAEEEIPASFETVAVIPRDPTGKLRRRDLVPGT